MPKTRITEECSEGTEVYEFGTDGKGRTVGARLTYGVAAYEDIQEENPASWFNYSAGSYYTLRTQATRNGKAFGASQPTHHFATWAERDAAAKKYLAAARKRA